MTYEPQEWVDKETVISAERLAHIEAGISAADRAAAAAQGAADDLAAAAAGRLAVSYRNNATSTIAPATETVPPGWEPIGAESAGVSYTPAGWKFQHGGVYLVAFTGSVSNAGTGSIEYRLKLSGTRVLALFGANDYSSRSGTVVLAVKAGDLLVAEYYQNTAQDVQIRPNGFNVVSIVQIR